MDSNKKQNIYKVIMLVVLTALITFIVTSIMAYNFMGGTGTKYVYLPQANSDISTNLASFRKILDQYYLGDIKDEELLNGAIKGYIDGLGDPYTEFYTKEEMEAFTEETMGNFVGVGVYMAKNTADNTIIVIAPIKGSPAYEAGILPGDIISKVDGVAYNGDQSSEASSHIKGEEGTKVKLEIIRNGEKLEFELTRKTVKVNHVESKVLDNNIGYLGFSTFDEGCAEEFKQEFLKLQEKGIKSLVIDIRNNGGGIVDEAEEIASLLLNKEQKIVITVDKKDNTKEEKCKTDPIINMNVVVLVNGSTASASEILAGALQDNKKATIVGEQTYGKGVMQELLLLNDGSGRGIKVTTNEYFTPNHNKVNGVGITPDVKVQLPEELQNKLVIDEKQDTQLQKAMEILK